MARSPKSRGQAIQAGVRTPEPSTRLAGLALAALLVALVAFVFGPAVHYDFVNLDDPIYVRDNPYVRMGLSWTSASWAFTTGTAGNWHPLTWLSHMLDVQLFGMNAGAHHAMSVAIHAVNTLALFGLLWRMTGSMWRSAFVAALFGVHPLHVESVAWISERKDVLSTLFWLATAGSYVSFVRSQRPRHMALACAFFALGLLAKSMLVSLPFILLLLDIWPLRRLTIAPLDFPTARRLLLEKAPLFAMAAASSLVALSTQRAVGTAASIDRLPLLDRVTHALIAYMDYAKQMLWPVNLAAFYPYPSSSPPLWQPLAVAATMAACTVVAVQTSRRAPYVFTGWFWFVIMMLPVIGLVQIGNQSMADRYTYLSLVGLFVIVAWGLPELLFRWPRVRRAIALGGVLAVAACAVSAREQARAWADSESLWRHALAGDPDNYYAHGALGGALAQKGDLAAAIDHFAAAVRLKPGLPEVELDWGEALARQGQVVEASAHFAEAVRLDPGFAEAHHNLGVALSQRGLLQGAIEEFRSAIRLNPDLVGSHHSIAIALARTGSIEESSHAFQEAIRLAPDQPVLRCDFALLLQQQGRTADAIVQLQSALTLDPQNERARAMLAALR